MACCNPTKPLTLGNECCPGEGRSYVRMGDTGPSLAPSGPRPPRPLAQPKCTRTVPGLRVGGVEAIADGQTSSEQGRSGCMEAKKPRNTMRMLMRQACGQLCRASKSPPASRARWADHPCTDALRGQLPGSSGQALQLSVSSPAIALPGSPDTEMRVPMAPRVLPTQHYFSS